RWNASGPSTYSGVCVFILSSWQIWKWDFHSWIILGKCDPTVCPDLFSLLLYDSVHFTIFPYPLWIRPPTCTDRAVGSNEGMGMRQVRTILRFANCERLRSRSGWLARFWCWRAGMNWNGNEF